MCYVRNREITDLSLTRIMLLVQRSLHCPNYCRRMRICLVYGHYSAQRPYLEFFRGAPPPNMSLVRTSLAFHKV